MRAWPPSSWLLAAVGSVLALDGLALLLFKGMASLGVTLPLGIGVALLVFVVWRPAVQTWMRASRWRRVVWQLALAAAVLWLLSLAVFFVRLAQLPHGAQAVAQLAPHAIIVLGSSTPQGQPSPALQARLDLAHELAQRFPQAVVAVSGGVDFGETVSEGQVMGDYLRAQGLPAARIVQEEASTSTDLNLKLSQPLLAARGVAVTDAVVVVTSDFHTARAQAIAQRQGWQQVQTVGAPTPLYLRYNAWLREYFAQASSRLLGEM
ncbi:hypothetical protein CCO03_08220 [Comamonas serinivorans]|uniref:DUF218 domain-containing protein n=2 Tax=Comamonas serinivorans TaxID=1082851 RepID=A0A1Y0ETU1_9BURK|nr:hypothetical protein CCO03_08220 [Comamonas serinivorans]